MSQRRSFTKSNLGARGFTMAEVVVSIAILSVGLMAVALLISRTLNSGTRARYENMASVLASEKLDNLNKWPANDPNVTPGGALGGGAACAAGNTYCDQVTVSESNGADYETQTQDVNGVPTTTTIVHTSAGCVDTPANCGVAAGLPGGSTFTRTWLITLDPTITSAGGPTVVAGVRRITVLVTLDDGTFKPPVTFQMSMVRP